MRPSTRRKGNLTFVDIQKNGSKLLKNRSNVSKVMQGIYSGQTNKWILVVFMLLVLPNFAMIVPHQSDSGSIDVVVIDAGHGGHDPGNLGTGRHRKKEKDVALATALLLGRYIEENIEGVKVIYTRDTDKSLELHERTAIANREHADLFISIHCNSGPRSAYGTETFVMGLAREEANLEVSKRENSVIFLEENYEENYEGFDPNSPVSNMANTIAQRAYLDQSIEFAALVQSQFKDRVNRRDRGVKQSVLYVLDYTFMPSALIELGFLTNSNEEDFLLSTRGQELMASAIFRAFRDYKNHRDAVNSGIQSQVISTTNNGTLPSIEENVPNTPPVEVMVPKKPEFRVQIAVSGNLLELVPQNFRGLEGVNYYQQGRLYKYTYGSFETKAEAQAAQTEAREAGYDDAYIIAFVGDEKISVEEAEKLIHE